jgi:hypothetical protein
LSASTVAVSVPPTAAIVIALQIIGKVSRYFCTQPVTMEDM